MDDFLREVCLDNHLDSLAVLAAQEPAFIIETLEGQNLDEERVAKLVAAANELLSDEERKDRDEIVARREETARRALEVEARAVAAAEAEAAAALAAANGDGPVA
jgi:hypothetical protein